jgi:hypothetical protein
VDRKVWLGIGLFGAAVAAASFGLIYLPVALGLVVVAYVLTGIMPLSEIYDHIEWPVVVLLGSMIPLGAALAQEQHPDPWPRRQWLWRLLAHGPAVGNHRRCCGDPRDPGLLAAVIAKVFLKLIAPPCGLSWSPCCL